MAFADGEVIAFDKNDRPTVEGIQYRDKRTGAWRHYFYDQNIYTEREYTDGEAGRETYYLITTKSPYSGTFYLKYSNGSLQLQFKISDGLRNGNSKYYKENGVLERTEKYRKGLLQN